MYMVNENLAKVANVMEVQPAKPRGSKTIIGIAYFLFQIKNLAYIAS